MKKNGPGWLHLDSLDRHRWGVFVPSVLVLLALTAALVVPPLFQRHLNARWVLIADVLEPARIVVGDIQGALAREMAAVRAYALTGDALFLERYRSVVAAERVLFDELRPLALSLGPEVVTAHGELERAAALWHERITEAEMLAGILDPDEYTERIPLEQQLWDRVLTASGDLREALLAEETAVRVEIRALDRVRLVTTAALLALGLLAALAAAWLGIRIQRLRVEAEQRRRELARLMESKTHLIRGITHDVKNPLGVISGYAELLQDGVLEGSAARQAHERIQEASRSALALVDDLLDLSLFEAGELRLNLEPLDLALELRLAFETHAAAAEKAGLAWTLRPPSGLPLVIADARRLRQILGNLLSNAIKYTPAGGSVELRARSVPAQEGVEPAVRVAVDVVDTGPGIPPDKTEEIFLEFTRLEPGTERGTGLGLAISRGFARAMGGDITVARAQGGGSVFTLWLPTVRARPA